MNIFIVEDELPLAIVLKQFLPRAIDGSIVTHNADAIEAATTLQTLATGDTAAWPDVIVSDYHLGSLTGDMVLEIGARLFPNCKLILMSGAADTQNIEIARAKVSRPFYFLQKPFFPAALVALIKR